MLRFTALLTLAYRTRVKSLLKGTFLYIVLLWDLLLYGEKLLRLGKIEDEREACYLLIFCFQDAFKEEYV